MCHFRAKIFQAALVDLRHTSSIYYQLVCPLPVLYRAASQPCFPTSWSLCCMQNMWKMVPCNHLCALMKWWTSWLLDSVLLLIPFMPPYWRVIFWTYEYNFLECHEFHKKFAALYESTIENKMKSVTLTWLTLIAFQPALHSALQRSTNSNRSEISVCLCEDTTIDRQIVSLKFFRLHETETFLPRSD